jgi:hypothetical protein
MALFATMERQKSEEFRLRSFRLRGERMTKAQAGAIDQHLSEFEILLDRPIDLAKIFSEDKYKELSVRLVAGWVRLALRSPMKIQRADI